MPETRRVVPDFEPPPDADQPGTGRGATPSVMFVVAIFLSAFLLFQLQLLMAKSLLPRFGGAPAVWTTCMLVYQILLLAGYAYAAGLSDRVGERAQARLHRALLLVSVALLAVRGFTSDSPLLDGGGPRPGLGHPVLQVALVLAFGIGLPFFLLSTTGPLLQSWFARTWPGSSSYRLYALSNLGSLLGLLSYPILIEPWLELRAQAWLWSVGYLAFAAASAHCSRMLVSRTSSPASPEPSVTRAAPSDAGAPEVGPAVRLLWFAASACGSLLLLAGTNMICQDVASVPLLWVLPLSGYLLTFILSFESDRWYRRGFVHPAFAAATLLAYLALSPLSVLFGPVALVGAYLLAVFAGCMVCHGELGRLKPKAHLLTSYYLMIAMGGAAGGVFTALIAPVIFPAFWEFHLALWAAAGFLLIVLLRDRDSWLHSRKPWLPLLLTLAVLVVPESEARLRIAHVVPHAFRWPPLLILVLRGAALHAAYLALRYRRPGSRPFRWTEAYVAGVVLLLGGGLAREAFGSSSHLLARSRNFYGVLTVQEIWPGDPVESAYELRHGRTTHGLQLRDPAVRAKATTYFHANSGVGLALLNHPRRLAGGSLRVGVVGLGVGTLAVYSHPGDSMRFYEINPEVIRFATDEHGFFSFLRDTGRGRIDVVAGDARLALAGEAARGELQQFDVLVIDAFSGDAIPVHLLTREAFELYLTHLASPDGILAVHTSNKSLDLAPVLGGMAQHFHLSSAMVRASRGPGGVWPSHWVLLSRSDSALRAPELAAASEPLGGSRGLRLWTDQYSNVLSVLR